MAQVYVHVHMPNKSINPIGTLGTRGPLHIDRFHAVPHAEYWHSSYMYMYIVHVCRA